VSSAPPVDPSPELSLTPDDGGKDEDDEDEPVTARVGPPEGFGAVDPPPPAGAGGDGDIGGGGGGGSWGGAPVSIANAGAGAAESATAATASEAAARTIRRTPARLTRMVGRVLLRAEPRRTGSMARSCM
jgi:hypothetical protein